MKNQSPERLEIFLTLALDHAARRQTGRIFPAAAEHTDSTLAANFESEIIAEDAAVDAVAFPALENYLSAPEAERFRRLRAEYEQKTAAEKAVWRGRLREKIGTDEQLVDEQVHRSHINEALQKETSAVQRIIGKRLPQSYVQSSDTFTGRRRKPAATGDLARIPYNQSAALALEKVVRRTFAAQFVSLRDLDNPTAFDRLNGAQLARLIRLTGIREVALACVRIEAVESVAAFLRVFSAEDAQAIAAQLNSLAKISEARLAFAEHLVQTTLELEQPPSAMLDLLGIWLIGILLCRDGEPRIRYTNQKLPLEIAAQLPEIVDEKCRQTPADLQQQISREIEAVAETLLRARSDKKSAGTRKTLTES